MKFAIKFVVTIFLFGCSSSIHRVPAQETEPTKPVAPTINGEIAVNVKANINSNGKKFCEYFFKRDSLDNNCRTALEQQVKPVENICRNDVFINYAGFENLESTLMDAAYIQVATSKYADAIEACSGIGSARANLAKALAQFAGRNLDSVANEIKRLSGISEIEAIHGVRNWSTYAEALYARARNAN